MKTRFVFESVISVDEGSDVYDVARIYGYEEEENLCYELKDHPVFATCKFSNTVSIKDNVLKIKTSYEYEEESTAPFFFKELTRREDATDTQAYIRKNDSIAAYKKNTTSYKENA